MPGFDFDKLKDQAEKYVKEHPDQVKKAEELGEKQLEKLFGKDEKGHGAAAARPAQHHDQEHREQQPETNRDGQ